MSYSSLLSVVARIHPEIWDAIVPHGPRVATTVGSGIDRVALNPQPLPPREAFLVGAAELAHQIVRTALDIEARGESSFAFVSDTIDEWCGTPWPRKWPLPWPGPGPEPWEALDVPAARLVAAVVFASVAVRIPDEKFGLVFADGADRLAEAALNGQSSRTAVPSRTANTVARTAARKKGR